MQNEGYHHWRVSIDELTNKRDSAPATENETKNSIIQERRVNLEGWYFESEVTTVQSSRNLEYLLMSSLSASHRRPQSTYSQFTRNWMLICGLFGLLLFFIVFGLTCERGPFSK